MNFFYSLIYQYLFLFLDYIIYNQTNLNVKIKYKLINIFIKIN